jgi:nucleoside-diphosphate-sugar epimerase
VIVGHGLLARAFAPRFGNDPDIVVFASGVSNSAETDAGAFHREEELLQEALAASARRLVYFSSCGVVASGEPATPYMTHKGRMEALVLASPGGLVLRLPQVVGRTENPHTLTNFLHRHIEEGLPFEIWSRAERNLIDVDDIVAIGSAMIDADDEAGRTQSIAARDSTPMPEIVRIFERVIGRRANCAYLPRGAPLPIDSAEAQRLAGVLGLDLGSGYAERIIGKYYGRHAIP